MATSPAVTDPEGEMEAHDLTADELLAADLLFAELLGEHADTEGDVIDLSARRDERRPAAAPAAQAS